MFVRVQELRFYAGIVLSLIPGGNLIPGNDFACRITLLQEGPRMVSFVAVSDGACSSRNRVSVAATHDLRWYVARVCVLILMVMYIAFSLSLYLMPTPLHSPVLCGFKTVSMC